jgi:hypothetical protein
VNVDPLEFTILGECASKANSRELVTRRVRGEDGKVKTRAMFIKSEKARAFERDALRQIPPACRMRLTGPVRVWLKIFYRTERPDLDESVVLDVLQDQWDAVRVRNGKLERQLVQAGVYRNDRQVRQRITLHGIDAHNPRVVVRVEPLTMQQCDLDFEGLAEEVDPLALA